MEKEDIDKLHKELCDWTFQFMTHWNWESIVEKDYELYQLLLKHFNKNEEHEN